MITRMQRPNTLGSESESERGYNLWKLPEPRNSTLLSYFKNEDFLSRARPCCRPLISVLGFGFTFWGFGCVPFSSQIIRHVIKNQALQVPTE